MKPLILLLTCLLVACNCSKGGLTRVPFSSEFVGGEEGYAGMQTPIYRDTLGNALGYYEYLPLDFDAHSAKSPLIIYWNGGNSISGNGRDELRNLLTQGLPQYIDQGKHYPAIIISAMLPDWKKNDVHPFVQFILKKYKGLYDHQKIYMTGFSAGGGVTIEYAARFPEKLAAIVPIAPAARKPNPDEPSNNMAKVSSWMFHNKGDTIVEPWRSILWNKELLKVGGDHRITLNDSDSHYAWQSTYSDPEMWSWLLSKNSNYSGER
jgi:predicted peptidase